MQGIANRTLLSATSSDQGSGLPVFNPANGAFLAPVPTTDTQQLNQAVERAHQAQLAWAKLPAKQRSEILFAWYQLLLDNQQDLARLMTLEQGKPLAEALGEVLYGASFIQWFAEEAKRAYGETIPAPGADKRIMTIKQPVGVTCAITPWNFPIAMITRKAAPALAAGCSMLIKPAEDTPLSALAIAELAYQAGIPKDLLQVVIGETPQQVGEVFCTHPLIRKLSFTGSTAVGKLLLEQVASDVKRCSLELGGNAPFIVFDDADIDAAVVGAIASKFRNAGQTCVCANRFYVHDAVYEEFVDKFAQAASALKVGDGLSPEVAIGPLINQAAKDKVLSLIDEALEQGAQLVGAPPSHSGLLLAPHVLRDVSHDMAIVRQEIFGPVAPIIRFSDEQALIAMANDSEYGLASYFYSRDIQRVFRVAEALEYGMVGVNEGIISTEVAPFGGVKHSGLGREGARQGLDEYLNLKYLCLGGQVTHG
ncbi:NAD-dependent succinate-semialdehyde dehydrogenase [Aliagarivorans marinus]|uniref:NAD-dependent succinate-semialdehyde dehydrogenase n=1 Tax=Aliagarivorans marinus TaxID=561965 RepID=UPI000424AC2F|nr:NAD-dependent succinate-semialdehyde dehydrogenase [Aliagarivorans marinus]